jgi:hypothetical protein
MAPTCFGSSLPPSGRFLDPSELLEIQIELVVYHIMCGYVAFVPECRGSVCCASQLSAHAAVKNIDAPMLTCVWKELEYRIGVCRVTRDAHIEHL